MSTQPQRAQSRTEDLEVNSLTEAVIGAAMRVHSALGSSLLESAYEACVCHELVKAGFSVQRQLALPVVYDGMKIDAGYRIDLIVNNLLIVEVEMRRADHRGSRSPVTFLSEAQREERRFTNQFPRTPSQGWNP